ncbi:MAG TPA: nucleotide pyrophosphohydrolase [Nitrososphaerales archaeon]|nr:nucleotide pyrophosphohydrolase [Nitrososphaerales archaeon]
MDTKTTVSTLREKVARFRDDRDWLKFHNPKDLSIGLSVESSELQELFLWKDVESVKKMLEDKWQLQRVREEIADVFIYLLGLVDVLDIDLSDAVAQKLALNAKKYPVSKSKGSNKKYDEL